jgi:hypothetical protein
VGVVISLLCACCILVRAVGIFAGNGYAINVQMCKLFA